MWHPIETAPKDGTPIVVWARWARDNVRGDACDRPYAAQVASWVDDVSYDFKSETFSGAWVSETFNLYTDYAVKPTHWMPLPAPPEVSHE